MVSHTEDAKLGNRLFGAFGFVSDEQHRAADFRMYNQQNLILHYMNQDNSFSIDGLIARDARGPMGLAELCTYKYVITGDGHIR